MHRHPARPHRARRRSGLAAPRDEVVVYRPGHTWVDGHWDRYSWQKNQRNYVWIDGGWRRREGVVIRDYR